MKSLNALGFDNSLKIKENSDKNSRFIDFIDSTVPKKELISFGSVKVGQIAYNYNGCKAGIVEDILDKNTIVIRGQFHRRNEWKETPWIKDEIDQFNNHSVEESHRVHNQTQKAIKAFNERESLAKQFIR